MSCHKHCDEAPRKLPISGSHPIIKEEPEDDPDPTGKSMISQLSSPNGIYPSAPFHPLFLPSACAHPLGSASGKVEMEIVNMYSVFTINVPLAVRFATVAIGMRKAESPEYGRFDRDLH